MLAAWLCDANVSIYWVDCIKFPKSQSPEDNSYWLWWCPDFSSATSRLTFLDEISWQPLGGFPLSLIQTLMVSRRWILMTLVTWWSFHLWCDIPRLEHLWHYFLYCHFHAPLRINCNNFGDCLTFHLAPSSGQNFNLSNTLWFALY